MLKELSSSSPVVRVYLFGPLELFRRTPDGSWKSVPKTQWRDSKPARSVFKRLLATPGRRLSRGTLIDSLWPETDFKLADKYLYNAMSIIHGVIGKELVKTWEGSYELAGQSLLWTDSDACEDILKMVENQRSNPSNVVPVLEETLSYLERGEYLEREEGTWCHGLRLKAEEMLKQCRLWLAEGYEQQGKFWQAGEQYRVLCQLFPTDENALRAWMNMLVRQGRPQDALRQYQEVKTFVEEQGFSLSSLTRRLATQIEEQSREEVLYTSAIPVSEQAILPWSLLLKEEAELASNQEIVYHSLETEVMTAAFQRKEATGPIVLLQQLVYEAFRKHDDAMREDHLNYEARITRRHALHTIAQFPIQMYGLAFLVGSQHILPPPDEFLPLCAASLTACLELRLYEEPEAWVTIRRTLAAYLPTLEKLAQQSAPTKQTAAHLASQGHLLVHMLADHYGKLDQMETAARRARFYGQIANDPNLEASSLIRLAVKFDYEHQYQKALEAYQEALSLPEFGRISPLLKGRLYGGLAGMYAICQQNALALSFLNQAKEIYPGVPESDPSFTFAYCGKQTLDLGEGLTLEYTGRYAEAIDVYIRYLPSLQEQRRAAGHLNKAAAVAIKQRDLDKAYFYLNTAEEEAQDTQQKQRLIEIRDTVRGMQFVWPHEPKVKTLQEKVYAR